jgi:hypothetical protein
VSQNDQNLAGRRDVTVEPEDARPDQPDTAAIAHEAEAIYPNTNAGTLTPEDIAAEAYRIFLGRGGEHGRDFEDWLEAERRLASASGQSEP